MQKKSKPHTHINSTPIALALAKSWDERKRYIEIGIVVSSGR